MHSVSGRLFESWEFFLGLGCGSGLSPKAPGTVGTVFAIPFYLILAELPVLTYLGVVIAALALGIHICDKVADAVAIKDPGFIVFDEFVGLWIALLAVPDGWYWIVFAFILFRIFDIFKPWPVSVYDRLGGGVGIMLDDVAAGLYSLVVLQLTALLIL